MEMKKSLMWMGIGGLASCALLAVILFLFGKFGETEAKLLATTFTIGWYGMFSFAAMREEGDGFARVQMLFGIGVALVGVMLAMDIIWWSQYFKMEDSLQMKWIGTCALTSAANAWVSLLRPSVLGGNLVKGLSYGGSVFVALTTMLLLILIWGEVPTSEMFIRILGVSMVLMISLSLAIPFARRLERTS